MANIGSFVRNEDGTFSGEIRTLRVKVPARFVPVEDKSNEQAPDLRIFAPGKVELGAAWARTSDSGLTYYSVALDDPSFAAPVYAALLPTESDPVRFNLAWSRPRREQDNGY
jgi:uncharacterized protein (DUF736 family)